MSTADKRTVTYGGFVIINDMSGRTRPRQLQIVTPEEELENLRNEVGVLRRAVESKSAAVGILRGELQECQSERDKFRTLAEQGPLHHPTSLPRPKVNTCPEPSRSAMVSGSEDTLAQLLSRAKEENRSLRQDATQLRCRLHDAQADIKVLREEVERWRSGRGRGEGGGGALVAPPALAQQQREQFISQMEQLSVKCQALEGDVRGLVEEREELVRELDASSHKLHRLNHIITTVLSSTPATPASPAHHTRRMIDLDAIITENRYLQQRVKQAEEETVLAKSNATKYKAALEKCRSQGSLKLGASDALIVTPKQVSELLQEYRGEMDGAAEGDIKSLCVALVDALNQRSRALRTQRLANKVLVGRVSELERRLSTGGGSEASESPPNTPREGQKPSVGLHVASLSLMEGYIPPSGPTRYKGDDILKDPRLTKLLENGEGEERKGKEGALEHRHREMKKGEVVENGRDEDEEKRVEGNKENGRVTNGKEYDGAETERNENGETCSDRSIGDGNVRSSSNKPVDPEEKEKNSKKVNIKNESESSNTSKSNMSDSKRIGNTVKNEHDGYTGKTADNTNMGNERMEPESTENRSKHNASIGITHDSTSNYNTDTANGSHHSNTTNISHNSHKPIPVSTGRRDASETHKTQRVPPTTTNVSASVESSKSGSSKEKQTVSQATAEINGCKRQNFSREANLQRKSNRVESDTSSLKQANTTSWECRHKMNESLNPDLQTTVNPNDELEEIVPIDQLDLYIREVRREASRTKKKAQVEEERRDIVEEERRDSVEERAEDVKEEQEDILVEEVKKAGEARDISEEKIQRKTGEELENTKRTEGISKNTREDNSNISVNGKPSNIKEPQKEEQSNSFFNDNEAIDEEANEHSYRNDRCYESEDDMSFNLDLSDYDSDDDKLDAALQAWQIDVGGKTGKKDGKKGKEGFSLWKKDGGDKVDLPPALKELLDGASVSPAAGTD